MWIKSVEVSQLLGKFLTNATSQVFIYLGSYILPSLIKRFNNYFLKKMMSWKEILTQARVRDHRRTWMSQWPKFYFPLATKAILISAHPEELPR